MGGDSLPAGPKGRGPFGPEDAFVLPDGRTYQPGDGPTDSLYGAALANPFVVPEQLKLVLGAGLIGVSVAIPTIFIKFVIGA
ncbi:hypothetical protein T484DRAFT_1966203 [Baffinella frigidus]|nr:hypothetical protein T484DRAFT_1966203 [Cryptophyta sp. CCMP2293]